MKKNDLFALSLIKGVGKKSLLNVLGTGYEISELISLSEDELGSFIKGSGKANAIDIIKNQYEQLYETADQEILKLSESNIELITYLDSRYPELYKKIPDPPLFLYAKGNLDLLNFKKSIAVIGTRECSEIGRDIAFKTAGYFAENGYNIVSGLATGIDTAGHKGALSVSGKTTAIVTDIERIYPSENEGLSYEILKKEGLLFSENPPGTIPHRGLFVSRDRLQSGLSLAVIPVETDIKGGTMHTVQFSQDQNRLLYCPDLSSVPNYPKDFPKSRGVLKLINDGIAKPFSKLVYEEMLKVFNDFEGKLWNKGESNIQDKAEQLRIKGT